MAKRLKLRLSRILTNCRSKDVVVPSDPLPVPKATAAPSSIPHAVDLPSSSARKQTFRWKHEKDFHVISISTVREKPLASAKVFPRPSVARRARRRRAMMQWGRKHGRVRLAPLPSVGMDIAWNEEGMEDDDREETEYSTSYSDKEANDSEASAAEETGMLLMRRRVSEVEFEARLSTAERRWRRGDGGVMRMTTTTTKVRESYAVVKRTEDPYGEFRRSMMEMVTEKEIYEEDELRELLWCLLSLNGREHHGIILRAFAEVYHALFRKKIRFNHHRYWFTTIDNY